ncbi:MAG: catechol 2,3-dioxygenase [Chloroflexi bacterium]|nr:MAG: catechol 2,3-dioxygenase [Chloroflexota bacterium]
MTIRAIVEIVLRVADMEKSLAFYRDTLGLSVFSPPELPGRFLRVGDKQGLPMQIVLVPGGSTTPAADATGLHHIGLEVAPHDWQPLRDRLDAAGHATRDGAHPFMPVDAFYLNDPDGNEVEIATPRA